MQSVPPLPGGWPGLGGGWGQGATAAVETARPGTGGENGAARTYDARHTSMTQEASTNQAAVRRQSAAAGLTGCPTHCTAVRAGQASVSQD